MTIILDGTNGVSDVDGSASTPAIRGTDTNTGIFFPAADTVGIATGGSERVRVDSSGNVGIGTNSPSVKLHVNSGSTDEVARFEGTGQPFVSIYDSNVRQSFWFAATSVVQLLAEASKGLELGTTTSQPITFITNTVERARITSGGDFLVGTASALGGGSKLSVSQSTASQFAGYFTNTNASGAYGLGISSQTGENIYLYYQGTYKGLVSTSSGGTTYGTTSDYRLKDNQQPLTGSGAFIDALQPKTWNWTADGSRGVGFIAHEVQEVSPSSVIGTKDAVGADGEPVMQTMEYGSAEFIANIIAELQSLRARVAALEAKGA